MTTTSAAANAPSTSPTFVGVPVVASFAAIGEPYDAVVVTDLAAADATFDTAAAVVGPDRVLAPKLLGVRPRPREEAIA